MYTFTFDSAQYAWLAAVSTLYNDAKKQESRNFRDADNTTETLELMPVCFTIHNPQDRVVFARPINPAFAIAEVIWILAGSNRLDFLEFWNPRMKTWSDDGVRMHGAYGYRLGSKVVGNVLVVGTEYYNIDQLHRVYDILRNKPYQRQVILQIWDSEFDLPNSYGTPCSKDIPCNIFADLKVRDGKLHWHQYMRSNDLIWGTPYNFIQWMTIQEIVAGWLGLECGPYHHIVSSLHVYKHHYEELERISELVHVTHGAAYPSIECESLAVEGYENWQQIFEIVVNCTLHLISAKSKHDTDVWFPDYLTMLAGHKGYRQWLWVLYYEALRRNDWLEEDFQENAKKNMGAYWWKSYENWYNSQKIKET